MAIFNSKLLLFDTTIFEMLRSYPGPSFQERPRAFWQFVIGFTEDDQDELQLTRVLIPAVARMWMCILIGIYI